MLMASRWLLLVLLCLALAKQASLATLERGDTNPDAGLPSSSTVTSYMPQGLFVENLGQWPAETRYCAAGSSDILWIGADGWVIDVPGLPRERDARRLSLHFAFLEASRGVRVTGREKATARFSSFIGTAPEKWVRGAASYSEVEYAEPWPGVGITIRFVEGAPKYTVTLAPGASLDDVIVRCTGADAIDGFDSDLLTFHVSGLAVTQRLGLCFQLQPDGTKVVLPGRFKGSGQGCFGFQVDGVDRSLPLIIDPDLHWATYIGATVGDVGDLATTVRRAPNGDLIVTGNAENITFPTTPGAYTPPGGPNGSDPFVARFRSHDGALLWSSVLGGPSTQERPTSLAIDSEGRPIVVGTTDLPGFPTTPGAFDTTFDGPSGSNIFVFKLSAAGDNLDFSTFLGPVGAVAHGVAVDSQDRPVVVGTTPQGFPTTPGTLQPGWVAGPSFESFVAKLDFSGSALDWSTLLGGAGGGSALAVALDADQNVVVGGAPIFPTFPTTPGAFQPQFPGSLGNGSGYVCKLTADASTLSWSTFLGGSQFDHIFGLKVDGESNVVVVGTTRSPDFPVTPGAFQSQFHRDPTSNMYGDSFVTYLRSDGSSAIYSTLVGGRWPDAANDVHVDASGVVTLAGITFGSYPTTPGAFDSTFNGTNRDGFVARLDPLGSKLLYSTYIGAPSEDFATGIVVGEQGVVSVMGQTGPGFPVTLGAFDTTYNGGGSDCYLALLDPLPVGIARYGRATPSCAGDFYIGAIEDASISRSHQTLYVSQGPGSAHGMLLISRASSTQGMSLFGASLWVDPAVTIGHIVASTGPRGYGEVQWSLPPAPPGTKVYAQFVARNTGICDLGAPVVASNALEITFQL